MAIHVHGNTRKLKKLRGTAVKHKKNIVVAHWYYVQMLGRTSNIKSDKNIGHKIGQIHRTKNRTNISDKKIPQKIGKIFLTKSRINVPNKMPDKKNRTNMSEESDKNSNKTSDRKSGKTIGQKYQTKNLTKNLTKSRTNISDKLIYSYFEKVHATIPKGIVSGFEFTVVQRNLKEWHERPWTHVYEC